VNPKRTEEMLKSLVELLLEVVKHTATTVRLSVLMLVAALAWYVSHLR
jgi:hypothetical protein